jgi:hypothetical protein
METKHARLSVWALLLFTCFALFGGQSAFAYDNTKMRAEAAGWVCKPGGTGPSGCEEVKLGLTGKMNKGNIADGRFEYMNKTTKFNVNGKITSLVVKPHNAAATADPSHPCYAAAIFDGGIQIAGPPLSAPYANITGTCDNGMCDQFVMTVVDDDSTHKKNDWVCNVHMHGNDKKGHAEVYDDPGQPLQKGSVEVHPE